MPLPQPYTGDNAWQISLAPVPAAEPASTRDHFLRGAIALAVNGIPIFYPLNNRGEDAFAIGELDEYGGHEDADGRYHYHAQKQYPYLNGGFHGVVTEREPGAGACKLSRRRRRPGVGSGLRSPGRARLTEGHARRRVQQSPSPSGRGPG